MRDEQPATESEADGVSDAVNANVVAREDDVSLAHDAQTTSVLSASPPSHTDTISTTGHVDDIAAQVEAWREQALHKRDPARFHRIEALLQRARGFDGEVRRVLDERLRALTNEFAKAIDTAPAPVEAPLASASTASSGALAASASASPSTSSPAAASAILRHASVPPAVRETPPASLLVALTTDITQRIGTGERAVPSAKARIAKPAAASGTPRAPITPASAASAATPDSLAVVPPAPSKRSLAPAAPAPVLTTPTVIATEDAFEDLDVLEYFRETWSKLSTDGNLRQSLAQVPENAGPLNSSHLVHRALSLMHDVSPDYLRHFLRHADALSWLEDMETTGVFGNRSAARVAASAKPSRAKAR